MHYTLNFPRFPSTPIGHGLWLRHLFTRLPGNEQTALFGALLPTPESQGLIVAHRAPLRSLKSKNSPLTHTHTCIAIHKHALTHPLTDTNTPFCPLPFPKPSCWPVWKISAIRALAAKSFPARYGPHISRFHTREHRRVSITGVLFLPSLWVTEWRENTSSGGFSMARVTADTSMWM